MKNITGVILLGGKSTRMGKDKKTLLYKEKTFLEHSLNLLKTIKCYKIILSGTNKYENKIYYNQYHNINLIPDILSNCGPLSGIYSVFKTVSCTVSCNKWFLFLPIDMPLLNEKIIKYLATPLEHNILDYNAICFKNYIFPLLLKNTTRVNLLIQKCLEDKNYSLKNLLNLLNLFTIKLSPYLQKNLANINTIKEYSLL